MNATVVWIATVIFVAYIAFIGGCVIGEESMAELKRNGYEVVKHEVRHGDFRTNWVEVVKREENKK